MLGSVAEETTLKNAVSCSRLGTVTGRIDPGTKITTGVAYRSLTKGENKGEQILPYSRKLCNNNSETMDYQDGPRPPPGPILLDNSPRRGSSRGRQPPRGGSRGELRDTLCMVHTKYLEIYKHPGIAKLIPRFVHKETWMR